ncbi:MAG: carboxyl transferase domain-containing protein [Isosphaeraceae bacterium]
MCGKAFDPRLSFAWPATRYAVMGAEQAARTMLDVTLAALERQGRGRVDTEAAELGLARERQYRETDIRYAAARGWVDAIIDPHETQMP